MSTENQILEALGTTGYNAVESAQKLQISIDEYQKRVATILGLRYLEEAVPFIDYGMSQDLDLDYFRDNPMQPLRIEEGILQVVTLDPIDFDLCTTIEIQTGYTVTISLTNPEALDEVREELFERNRVLNSSTAKISEELMEEYGESSDLSVEALEKSSESEPVVRLSRLILDESIALNASDIHIEPMEQGAVVRFRIDGMLRKHIDLEPWLYSPLTSRLKIMAGLDIAEKRVPQDGRIRYRGHGELFDLRVSTLPTHLGEKTVIRLLKQDFSFLNIDHIGLPAKAYSDLVDIINKPQGLFLVTGPTGSGKSSTLFAALNRIKSKEINITTIENPVEYKLAGINQVQINEKAGITFAATLRSILRQDPDVILVGETRDRETAEIALQASQTGHLVFSTLHTNDSVAAVTRLKDLGIAGYLISSSLVGVMAQRLVRKLCPHCTEFAVPTTDIEKQWNRIVGDFPFQQIPLSKGCDHCRQMGYSGRTGIFELFAVTDEIRNAISDDLSEYELRNLIREQGFSTLLTHGIQLVEEGKTSVEEVLRVVTVTDRVG